MTNPNPVGEDYPLVREASDFLARLRPDEHTYRSRLIQKLLDALTLTSQQHAEQTVAKQAEQMADLRAELSAMFDRARQAEASNRYLIEQIAEAKREIETLKQEQGK